MTRLLVYRFSAMGDVILLLPVLKGVLDLNNDVEIYLLTQRGFFPFFQDIERLSLIEFDFKGKNKGFKGLFVRFLEIKKSISPDKVIDLHCVLRSFLLDMLFLISGFRVITFKKGTFKKRQLIRSKNRKSLPNTIDRYAESFIRAGYKLNLPEPSLFPKTSLSDNFCSIFDKSLLIGIAPFAKHQQKIWGLTKIEELISEINRLYDANILLFGGGKAEFEILNEIARKHKNCIVSGNHFKLADEIKVMSKLSLMVSMDSANMHLASIAGVPTISIWGATHPSLGFAPYRQPIENLIQYDGTLLSCRPCSVYGNKRCIFSDEIRCMQYISVNMVLDRIKQILPMNTVAIT